MKKTVCELFAGVGGFRCGLNHINTLDDLKKKKNGRQYGLINGNRQRKQHSMPMIVIYIILELV